jgi:hypothetical protein
LGFVVVVPCGEGGDTGDAGEGDGIEAGGRNELDGCGAAVSLGGEEGGDCEVGFGVDGREGECAFVVS